MNRIVTFFKDKTKTIKDFPKTLTKCVYDESGKRLDNVIDDINENLIELQSNNLGNYVDIISYNSTTKRYTVPHDGYVRLFCANGTASNWSGLCVGKDVEIARAIGNGTYTGFASVFVKKGMEIYVTGSNNRAWYLPLEE